jgi:hypothetical protein
MGTWSNVFGEQTTRAKATEPRGIIADCIANEDESRTTDNIFERKKGAQ